MAAAAGRLRRGADAVLSDPAGRPRGPRSSPRSRPCRPTWPSVPEAPVAGATTDVPPRIGPGQATPQRHRDRAQTGRSAGATVEADRLVGDQVATVEDDDRRRRELESSAPSSAAATGSGPGSSPAWPSPPRRSSSWPARRTTLADHPADGVHRAGRGFGVCSGRSGRGPDRQPGDPGDEPDGRLRRRGPRPPRRSGSASRLTDGPAVAGVQRQPATHRRLRPGAVPGELPGGGAALALSAEVGTGTSVALQLPDCCTRRRRPRWRPPPPRRRHHGATTSTTCPPVTTSHR